MKTKSIAYQVRKELYAQKAFGESKHRIKQNGEDYNGKIFSKVTFSTYEKECIAFGKWCKAEYGCRNIADDKQYVGAYLQRNIEWGYSPWTIRLRASALAKLYRCNTQDFSVELPKRQRTEIKRSRNPTRGFSENRNLIVVNFCKGTGMRRHEILALKPNSYVESGSRSYVYVENGKGGKPRYAYVLPEYRDLVRECFQNAVKLGKSTVFEKGDIKVRMPVHHYRAVYAQAFYNRICRSIDEIPKAERYYCRKDKAGIVYDKKALLIVSRSLGHNRCDVVATNYLY
ncbi:MAG: hypothetical protein Q4C50_03215 [Eubacteriales bacterium]|nr:hypothetical protein [Eubacteriales bacterium]